MWKYSSNGPKRAERGTSHLMHYGLAVLKYEAYNRFWDFWKCPVTAYLALVSPQSSFGLQYVPTTSHHLLLAII